jgi:hypothetical protein
VFKIPESLKPPPGRKPSWLERAEWFFTFLVFFAGFFYLTREARTDAQ